MLDLPATLDPAARPAAMYLAATVHALARDEQAGRRPRRLTEPGHATWQRFRGRLGPREFVEILLEDAAVVQPEPFDAAAILGAADWLRPLSDALIGDWLAEATNLPAGVSDREYFEEQAKRLGLKARPAFSDLPKLAPHHRVLELPGSGGRLAAHATLTQPGVPFKDIFTVACASWEERLLVGIIAAALDARGFSRVSVDPKLNAARRADPAFTHVFGLRPEKGGAFDAHTLEGFFPTANVVLV